MQLYFSTGFPCHAGGYRHNRTKGFSETNNAFPGTREVLLTDPIVSKPVGLIWEKVSPPLPMAQAMADLLGESMDELFATAVRFYKTARGNRNRLPKSI